MVASTQRGAALLTTLLVVLSSAGTLAQSPPAEPTPSDVYTSDDGLLTIEVPPGAAPPQADIRAIYRPPEERPDELAEVETRSGFYELLPASQEFEMPVRITRTILLDELGFDLEQDGLPLIPLALRSVDGSWEWLDELVIGHDLDAGSITVSGTTTHFSTVVGLGGTAFLRESFDSGLQASPDDPFVFEIELVQPAGLGAHIREALVITEDTAIAAPGTSVFSDDSATMQVDCLADGTTRFAAIAWIDNIGGGLQFFDDLGLMPAMMDWHAVGAVDCVSSEEPPTGLRPKAILGTAVIKEPGARRGGFEAPVRFVPDADGTYDRIVLDGEIVLDALDADLPGLAAFMVDNRSSDELWLLRPGEQPDIIDGVAINGGRNLFPRTRQLIRALERARPQNVVDRILSGERISNSMIRSLGGRPRQLGSIFDIEISLDDVALGAATDILPFGEMPGADRPPESRPATVGVVDQDAGLWYLVDPVLADLSGSNEVDGGDLSASGRGQLTFNSDAGKICFDLDLLDLEGDVTAAHVHAGKAGVDGDIVVDLDFPGNGNAGCVAADTALIDEILADLDAFFINVHSDVFPAGAVRGQLGGGPLPPFLFGDPGDDPFLGDWDGDGIDTPGLYRPSDGKVYLRNSNTPGIADIEFFFGDPKDIPLIGDWDGDGDDTVSLYRPSEGKVFITNMLGSDDQGLGKADIEFLFGDPGDDPFGADFDGDGKDSIGVRRGDVFWWRNSLDAGPFDNDGLEFGDLDDEPMFGDWDGDGVDTPGVYRPATSTIFLRNIQSPGIADMEIFTDGFESGDTSAWSTSR